MPVCVPLLNHTDYYNRKGWYLVIVQAVVDHWYRFIDILAGLAVFMMREFSCIPPSTRKE